MYAVPSAPPENLVVTLTTSRTISISWSPPPFDQQNGLIRYYLVYLTEINGNTLELQTSDNSTDFTIENVVPIYNYTVSLAAYTIGVGPSTSVLTISIPESGKLAPLYTVLDLQ